MKPFNLEEYLANPNKKLVTREGRNARIVCTDFKTKHNSVLALVDYGKYECTISCNKEGRHCYGERESANDLFFTPEKHEGWINMYKTNFVGTEVFNTPDSAKEYGMRHVNYVATIKIEWEE